MRKILLTGANGQLATEIADLCNSSDRYVFLSRKELDISNKQQIANTLAKYQPGHLINCAAYTKVDQAEQDRDLAMKINGEGPTLLAQHCVKIACKLLHVSTDYVFDGKGAKPYKVHHPVDPVNFYGYSKLQGELGIQEIDPSAVIIRTSWLYSTYGHNFLKTMLRLGADRATLNVVGDQWGSPTYAADLAKLLIDICESERLTQRASGVYHYANAGKTSWAGFARKIMEYANLDCKVSNIDTAAYPTPAKRPAYSVMDKSRIKRLTKCRIPKWQEALSQCIQKIKGN